MHLGRIVSPGLTVEDNEFRCTVEESFDLKKDKNQYYYKRIHI